MHNDETVELAAAVAAMLSRHGSAVDASRLRLARSPHGSSCHLFDVHVDGGSFPPLLLKELSPTALLPEATAVRPRHLYDPLREIATYVRILSPSGIGAKLHGWAVERRGHRFLLLIEKIPADALDYNGDFPAWLAAARWIGQMHSRFSARPLDRTQRRHLARIDGTDFRHWLERADAVAHGQGGDALSSIVGRSDELVGAFDRLPRTFVHGELFASNVIVDAAHGVFPVDWELAAIGPGVIDIAALSSGRWSSDERTRLVSEYAAGAGIDDRPRLERDVALARLYLSLRLIAWADDWTPPGDEQFDWLAEARDAYRQWMQ